MQFFVIQRRAIKLAVNGRTALPGPQEAACGAADERDINKPGEFSVFSEGKFSHVLSHCAK